MSGSVHYLKDRGVDSEKITLNLGFVDLGRIDLLVQEGFYSNRTDLIRTAIGTHLDKHAEALKELIVRHTLDVGLREFSRADLEAAGQRERNSKSASSGSPALLATFPLNSRWPRLNSITVLGALQASDEVKAALAGRIG